MAIQRVSNIGPPLPAAPGTATKAGSKADEGRPAAVARPAVNDEALRQALQHVKNVVQPVARNLQFSVDDETGRTIVKVIDGATKEVIRQIPSEELLEIAHSLERLQGVLLRQKA